MRFSGATLALAALGFECAVTHAKIIQHRHLHKHRRDIAVDMDKRGEWVTATNDFGDGAKAFSFWSDSPAATTSAPVGNYVAPTANAVVTSTTQSSAASSSTASSSTTSTTSQPASQSSSSSYSGATCCYSKNKDSAGPGFGERTTPKNSTVPDGYIANIGGAVNTPGCGKNMQHMTTEPDKNVYKYTMKISNSNTATSMGVWVWNKNGCDGQPQSGMWMPAILSFEVPAGGSSYVVFDENSVVAWSKQCARSSGATGFPTCTIGEAAFGDLRNNADGDWDSFGHSGYDVSSETNKAGNVETFSIKSNCGADSNNLRKRINNWVAADQANQGASPACNPGPMHLDVTMTA